MCVCGVGGGGEGGKIGLLKMYRFGECVCVCVCVWGGGVPFITV